jgi:hypothetical protein
MPNRSRLYAKLIGYLVSSATFKKSLADLLFPLGQSKRLGSDRPLGLGQHVAAGSSGC